MKKPLKRGNSNLRFEVMRGWVFPALLMLACILKDNIPFAFDGINIRFEYGRCFL